MSTTGDTAKKVRNYIDNELPDILSGKIDALLKRAKANEKIKTIEFKRYPEGTRFAGSAYCVITMQAGYTLMNAFEWEEDDIHHFSLRLQHSTDVANAYYHFGIKEEDFKNLESQYSKKE